MEKWEEQRIKEIENKIDNTIVGLNTTRCMLLMYLVWWQYMTANAGTTA